MILIEEISGIIIRVLPNALFLALVVSAIYLFGILGRSFQKIVWPFKIQQFLGFFIMAFYVAMLFSITLLSRDFQPNPFKDVTGKWFLKYRSGLWHHGNIENILLFLPLCPLVIINIKRGHKYSIIGLLWRGIILSLGATLLIEILQAVFHRGTFQLSDLFFNTIGGLIGLLFYMAVREIRRRRHG